MLGLEVEERGDGRMGHGEERVEREEERVERGEERVERGEESVEWGEERVERGGVVVSVVVARTGVAQDGVERAIVGIMIFGWDDVVKMLEGTVKGSVVPPCTVEEVGRALLFDLMIATYVLRVLDWGGGMSV